MNIKFDYRKYYLLDIFLYILPFTIILGNSTLNSTRFLILASFIYNFFKYKLYIKYKIILRYIYLISICIILNVIFSENYIKSLIGSISLIGYLILFLSILFMLDDSEAFKKNFTLILLSLTIFVIIDLIIQYYFKSDIFGYEVSSSHGYRLSGPFGDELVPGSFLSKLLFLGSIFLVIKRINNFYILIYLSIASFIIVLTNERSASIMFASGLFIFVFLSLRSIKIKLLSIFFLMLCFYSVFSLNNELKKHFIEIPIKYLNDNHHLAHFQTSIEIFKDHKISGAGLKNFRILCDDQKYENIKSKYVDNRCATHVHNIYLEILSETGLIGFIIFVTLNLNILFFFIQNLFKKLDTETILLMSNYFVLFWPIQTTGAFFSSWNGVFYWIFLAFFFYKKMSLNSNNQI